MEEDSVGEISNDTWVYRKDSLYDAIKRDAVDYRLMWGFSQNFTGRYHIPGNKQIRKRFFKITPWQAMDFPDSLSVQGNWRPPNRKYINGFRVPSQKAYNP